jgi:hypothetical protein
MKKGQRLKFRVFAAMALLGIVSLQSAQAQSYVFRSLTLEGAFDPFGFSVPALNSGGMAAFAATLPDGTQGVFRSDAGAITPIALQGDFSRFGDVSINSSGQVGFEGSFENIRGEGIFRGAGAAVTTIAGTRDAGDFDFVNAGPSLNGTGQVAFIGERIVSGNFIDGVYVGNGDAVQAIYDTTSGFSDFTGNPALNDNGTAAFLATTSAGVGGLFLGNGGAFTTVADENGILSSVFSFSDPALNQRGDVAFRAGINRDDPDDNFGSTGAGVFLFRDGTLTLVAETPSLAFDFGDPALNDLGEVAYLLSANFVDQSLVIGSDPLTGRVIGTGDTLFGKTITGLNFGREGFNSLGQLAFTAFFDDGTAGIFLASPVSVPEPDGIASCVIMGIGLICFARHKNKKFKKSS